LEDLSIEEIKARLMKLSVEAPPQNSTLESGPEQTQEKADAIAPDAIDVGSPVTVPISEIVPLADKVDAPTENIASDYEVPPSEDETAEGRLPDYIFEEINHGTGEISDIRDSGAEHEVKLNSEEPPVDITSEHNEKMVFSDQIKRYAVPCGIGVGFLAVAGAWLMLNGSPLNNIPYFKKPEKNKSALELIAPPVTAPISSVQKPISSAKPVLTNISSSTINTKNDANTAPQGSPALRQQPSNTSNSIKPIVAASVNEPPEAEEAEEQIVPVKRSIKHKRKKINKLNKRPTVKETNTEVASVAPVDKKAIENVLGELVKARSIQ